MKLQLKKLEIILGGTKFFKNTNWEYGRSKLMKSVVTVKNAQNHGPESREKFLSNLQR